MYKISYAQDMSYGTFKKCDFAQRGMQNFTYTCRSWTIKKAYEKIRIENLNSRHMLW
jgi:hypothetical protein